MAREVVTDVVLGYRLKGFLFTLQPVRSPDEREMRRCSRPRSKRTEQLRFLSEPPPQPDFP